MGLPHNFIWFIILHAYSASSSVKNSQKPYPWWAIEIRSFGRCTFTIYCQFEWLVGWTICSPTGPACSINSQMSASVHRSSRLPYHRWMKLVAWGWTEHAYQVYSSLLVSIVLRSSRHYCHCNLRVSTSPNLRLHNRQGPENLPRAHDGFTKIFLLHDYDARSSGCLNFIVITN